MMHCMTVGDGRKWVKRPEGLGKLCQSSREISTGQTTMTGVLPSTQIPKALLRHHTRPKMRKIVHEKDIEILSL